MSAVRRSAVLRRDSSCGGTCEACRQDKPCKGKKAKGRLTPQGPRGRLRDAPPPGKRTDAAEQRPLSAKEYMRAAELGIDNRSRSYIRSRFDTIDKLETASQERIDKKCGGSGIADNKKCNKGGGGTARKVATGAAVVGGLALAAALMRRRPSGLKVTPRPGGGLPGRGPGRSLLPAGRSDLPFEPRRRRAFAM